MRNNLSKRIGSFLLAFLIIGLFSQAREVAAITIFQPKISIFLPPLTPTPTIKIKIIIPPKEVFIPTGLFISGTPVPAAPTPTTGLSPAQEPTIGEEPDLEETIVVEENLVSPTSGLTPMPTPTPSRVDAKEAIFIGMICLLLVIIVFQGRWPSIKDWLHRKTEQKQ